MLREAAGWKKGAFGDDDKAFSAWRTGALEMHNCLYISEKGGQAAEIF